jgi:hypothetical protein
LLTKTAVTAAVESVCAVMNVTVDNIAKLMAAKMRSLIAAAVPVTAIAGIISTVVLVIATGALAGALARAKHMEGNSYIQISVIVLDISLVSTPGRNVPKTPIVRKSPRVTSKSPMTIPKPVRVSLVIAQVDPPPVARKKILPWKKEKSLWNPWRTRFLRSLKKLRKLRKKARGF